MVGIQLILTPYLPYTHGVDILLSVWTQAAILGEQIQIFGPVAASPQGFVANYVQQADMLLLHIQDMPYDKGLIALVWADDIFYPARARLHVYVLPKHRPCRFIRTMAWMVLSHFFDLRGFHLLYEIIPVTYTQSVRLANALGFEQRTILEHGAMDPTGAVDGIVMVLRRERWVKRRHTCRG